MRERRASAVGRAAAAGLVALTTAAACVRGGDEGMPPAEDAAPSAFDGSSAGATRTVAGLELRWCPPGTFTMGSPPDEPERRPGEDQVRVHLSRGFWTARFETTQGEWKRVVGALPGPPTS